MGSSIIGHFAKNLRVMENTSPASPETLQEDYREAEESISAKGSPSAES